MGATPGHDRQDRLLAVERLDPTLLIDAEREGAVGWQQVKPDDVGQIISAHAVLESSTGDRWQGGLDLGPLSPHPSPMAATLLSLSNGHYSLEFDPADLPAVASAIRNHYGVPDKRQYPICAEYRFGGCSFTFQNEWDDPCLVSGSAEGDDILKHLHEILDAPT